MNNDFESLAGVGVPANRTRDPSIARNEQQATIRELIVCAIPGGIG